MVAELGAFTFHLDVAELGALTFHLDVPELGAFTFHLDVPAFFHLDGSGEELRQVSFVYVHNLKLKVADLVEQHSRCYPKYR